MKKEINPKVSIITPTLNSSKTLERCISSVKDQTYKNIEHIIIDGLSTDNTIEIIKRNELKYNIKWISEKDCGVADAMNKGFKIAEGEIFTWIDADNFYIHNDLIEKMVNMYSSRDVDMVITNCYSQHEGSSRKILIEPKDISFTKLLNKGSKFMPECVYFNRDLFFKVGGFSLDYKLLADYELWLKIFRLHPSYVRLEYPSIIYIANDASLLRRKPIQSWLESFDIGKKYGRNIVFRILFKIRFIIFIIKYPLLKMIKKNTTIKSTLIRIFR